MIENSLQRKRLNRTENRKKTCIAMCVYLYINCFYTTYICKLFFCESSRFAHLPFTFSFSLFAEKTFIAPPYQKNSLKTKLRKKSKNPTKRKRRRKKNNFFNFWLQ